MTALFIYIKKSQAKAKLLENGYNVQVHSYIWCVIL